jgi:nitrite reductase/ring-hydroxylating ferredoxin subunit
MRELKVGETDSDKVLIAKYQGQIYSVGNFCTHFGAPLTWGALFEDKVKCPWHAAAFSIVTGELEGAPSLDGLPKFDVVERDGRHFVKVPAQIPKSQT